MSYTELELVAGETFSLKKFERRAENVTEKK